MSKELENKFSPLATNENFQNASSLLALMHGKSDSICRLFYKEIIINLKQLRLLNQTINEKLALNQVPAITTNVDISLRNKKIFSFKTWNEFEVFPFDVQNSAVSSIFIQWDFFLLLEQYRIPQRHTLSLRISSSPNPSDVIKAIVNGGLDSDTDIDVQICTMWCKVDFINHILAEELINVVDSWNSLCECAISKKGHIRPILYKRKLFFAKTCEFFLLSSEALLLCLIVNYAIIYYNIITNNRNLLYSIILFYP